MRSTSINRHTHLKTTLLVLATLLAAAAPMTAAADTAYLEFTSDGLEPLGPGFVYEGWLIVDGAPVSAGRFSVAADGSLSRSAFAIEVDDIAAAVGFLASPSASYITGQTIHVNGGMYVT